MNPAKSIEIFAFYLFALGLGIVFQPALLWSLILLPPPQGDAVLFLGFVVLLLGFYYFAMARSGVTVFFRVTVWGRAAIFLATLAWVVLGGLAANYLVLLAVDLAGAIWTLAALRRA